MSNVVPGCWGRCGGMANSFGIAVKQLSEPKKHCGDCLMLSALWFHGPCLQLVVHYLLMFFFWECATPPHFHPTSRYIIAHDQCSPALVLQVTNAGVRWPGYEARSEANRPHNMTLYPHLKLLSHICTLFASECVHVCVCFCLLTKNALIRLCHNYAELTSFSPLFNITNLQKLLYTFPIQATVFHLSMTLVVFVWRLVQ